MGCTQADLLRENGGVRTSTRPGPQASHKPPCRLLPSWFNLSDKLILWTLFEQRASSFPCTSMELLLVDVCVSGAHYPPNTDNQEGHSPPEVHDDDIDVRFTSEEAIRSD